jgi:chemotaxis response regulator CheB
VPSLSRNGEESEGGIPQKRAYFANAAFDVVALAASACGPNALGQVLGGLPLEFPAAILIVQHADPRDVAVSGGGREFH